MHKSNMKCLNTFSQILFLFALSGCAANKIIDFDNAATLSNSDKYLAFVGEKIQIVEFDPAEDDPETSEEDDEDTIIIHMDSAYKARYRILELVHGGYDREIVDFKVYDHYGFPTFAESNVAMLYLTEYDGALYHVKYLFDISILRLTDDTLIVAARILTLKILKKLIGSHLRILLSYRLLF